MRFMTTRDLTVVAVTAIAIALIGTGTYVFLHSKKVETSLNNNNQTEQANITREEPRAGKRPVKRTSRKSRKLAHASPSPERTILIPQPVLPQQSVQVSITQPLPDYRPPVQSHTVYRSEPIYREPVFRNDDSQSKADRGRGMKTWKKVAIGSAIGGGIVAAIVLSRKRR